MISRVMSGLDSAQIVAHRITTNNEIGTALIPMRHFLKQKYCTLRIITRQLVIIITTHTDTERHLLAENQIIITINNIINN